MNKNPFPGFRPFRESVVTGMNNLFGISQKEKDLEKEGIKKLNQMTIELQKRQEKERENLQKFYKTLISRPKKARPESSQMKDLIQRFQLCEQELEQQQERIGSLSCNESHQSKDEEKQFFELNDEEKQMIKLRDELRSNLKQVSSEIIQFWEREGSRLEEDYLDDVSFIDGNSFFSRFF